MNFPKAAKRNGNPREIKIHDNRAGLGPGG